MVTDTFCTGCAGVCGRHYIDCPKLTLGSVRGGNATNDDKELILGPSRGWSSLIVMCDECIRITLQPYNERCAYCVKWLWRLGIR